MDDSHVVGRLRFYIDSGASGRGEACIVTYRQRNRIIAGAIVNVLREGAAVAERTAVAEGPDPNDHCAVWVKACTSIEINNLSNDRISWCE